jgi:hypothetical protein
MSISFAINEQRFYLGNREKERERKGERERETDSFKVGRNILGEEIFRDITRQENLTALTFALPVHRGVSMPDHGRPCKNIADRLYY